MKNSTKSKRQTENEALISLKLNSKNIVEIELAPTLSKIRKSHLLYINKNIQDLGGGKKLPACIHFTGFMMLSKSAIKYRSTEEYARYRLANAFLVDSFSKAVIYNFYLEADTSSVPVASFKEQKKAFDWLETFMVAA
ncbi:hypothetical protein CNR22_18855 [Sphingobacteriaceae bacterium]|nr:hypothetical protein CNR22_18855 [Sphingobacteriaceae bacterium]